MNSKIVKKSNNYRGPIFLIGMPRSGTKLLRGLLNEHSRIAIPAFETEFFPYWIMNWDEYGDLSDRAAFSKFYEQMMKVPYFIYCKNEAELISEETWYNNCQSFTPASVFEGLVRHDADAAYESDVVWGDKSPSYITSLEMIKEHFPNARFVHIIRDVRDYCLSINHAWKKNMIRAAQRWNDYVENARTISSQFNDEYMELKYEDLLDSPETELKRIVEFLDLEFEESMLTLSRPTENIGATTGQQSVVKSNKKKYDKLMQEALRLKIESITGNTLESLSYEVANPIKPYKVPPYLMFYYKMLDGFNMAFTTMKRIGIKKAFKYVYGAFLITRN